MEAATLDPEVITAARETATSIQSDPRMAVIGYNKRLQIESLTREVEEVDDRILSKRQERAIWMNSLPEIAHSHADDNHWCEEFDRAMEEAGLPPRIRRQTINVYGSMSVRIGVDAQQMVEQEFSDYTVDDVDTVTVYATIDIDDDCYIEVEVDTGECGCNDVDTEPSRGELGDYSSAADRFDDDHPGGDYTFTANHCTNCD